MPCTKEVFAKWCELEEQEQSLGPGVHWAYSRSEVRGSAEQCHRHDEQSELNHGWEANDLKGHESDRHLTISFLFHSYTNH